MATTIISDQDLAKRSLTELNIMSEGKFSPDMLDQAEYYVALAYDIMAEESTYNPRTQAVVSARQAVTEFVKGQFLGNGTSSNNFRFAFNKWTRNAAREALDLATFKTDYLNYRIMQTPDPSE